MADEKKYPNSTPGVANLLHMNPTDENNITDLTPVDLPLDEANDDGTTGLAEKTVTPPAGLPIMELEPLNNKSSENSDNPSSAEPISSVMKLEPVTETKASDDAISNLEPIDLGDNLQPGPGNKVVKILKNILPYIVIFAIGVGLYFFYFSDFSFRTLFQSELLKVESVEDVKDKNLEQLKVDVADDYKTWVGQFFIDVNDDSIISMDSDVSGNGLTNLEKYLLNLNPKVFSTRGGMGDGQSVIADINPWTGKPFTDKQKQLVEKFINPELISNRITAAAITRGVTKYAQYVNPDSPYYIDPETLQRVGDNSQVVVAPTLIPSSDPTPTPNPAPNNNPAQPTSNNKPNPNSGAEPLRADQSIDQSKPGVLEIPANQIRVPLIWTQDVKDFDNDLKRGVVHYPGTALPGEVGLAYISGHSSGYVWENSPYKQIFDILGQVKDGTSFTITATLKNGKIAKYNYVVERRGEYAADDQKQFISTAESVVALSTCWPVGTVDRRLVLFAKLTQVEK